MVREMGAMMTAIIMAGRTGAAFAAQLGTMKVNEEIDALTTHGHLADGVPGPAAHARAGPDDAAALRSTPTCSASSAARSSASAMLDLSRRAVTCNETIAALTLADFVGGIVKGTVFGVLVAIAGCLRGMQCGRSASAVGDGGDLRRWSPASC